jgi:SAM-dependent methyltransferase
VDPTPWHENDELWAELEPALCDESMLQAAVTEARQAAALLRVEPGAHLLDLGCGPGRHAIELARLDYRVTGVDRTAGYLDRARQRASDLGLEIELVRETMLGFRRDEVFDGAINLLSSFGYFEERKDDLQVMRNLHASLKPGARAAVDVMGKEILPRLFVQRHWQELKGGRFWLSDREMLPGWEKMRNHWVFVGGGERKEFVFEHRIYSGLELADLMRQAGFAEVSVFGGFDGQPYDRNAARLVAVGLK